MTLDIPESQIPELSIRDIAFNLEDHNEIRVPKIKGIRIRRERKPVSPPRYGNPHIENIIQFEH